MRRVFAFGAGLLLIVHAVPAKACRSADFHRFLIAKRAPIDPLPHAVVLEVSDVKLPQDRTQLTPLRARVVRVIQGEYDESTVTIVSQARGNCTSPSERYAPISGYVVGKLVRAEDGSLALDAQAQKPDRLR